MRKALFLLALALPQAPVLAAPMTPPGKPVAIRCTGPVALAARKVAVKYDIKAGMNPSACFGKMQIYDGPNFQYVAVVPSPACSKGKALDVYSNSRAGPWYSYFEKPVCGSTISVGPKNQWGDWMLTIDGRHYSSRGQYYVLMP
ncbi:MAG: hypothetical protein ABI898_04055 [Sphingomonadales bacterium]